MLVTGGSQGIGKTLAEQLLANGARETLLARTAATLEKAVGELKSKREGASVQSVSASITDYSALKAAVGRLRNVVQKKKRHLDYHALEVEQALAVVDGKIQHCVLPHDA